MYKEILSAQIKTTSSKLMWHFTLQMDDDPNHTVKATSTSSQRTQMGVVVAQSIILSQPNRALSARMPPEGY